MWSRSAVTPVRGPCVQGRGRRSEEDEPDLDVRRHLEVHVTPRSQNALDLLLAGQLDAGPGVQPEHRLPVEPIAPGRSTRSPTVRPLTGRVQGHPEVVGGHLGGMQPESTVALHETTDRRLELRLVVTEFRTRLVEVLEIRRPVDCGAVRRQGPRRFAAGGGRRLGRRQHDGRAHAHGRTRLRPGRVAGPHCVRADEEPLARCATGRASRAGVCSRWASPRTSSAR